MVLKGRKTQQQQHIHIIPAKSWRFKEVADLYFVVLLNMLLI